MEENILFCVKSAKRLEKDLGTERFSLRSDIWITSVSQQPPRERQHLALTDTHCHWQPWAMTTKDRFQLLVFVYPKQYKQPEWLSLWSSLAMNQTHHFISSIICPAAGYKLYVLYVALFMTWSVWVQFAHCWYLALWFVWSVSRSPWGWHICQAWHWSCRCWRGWQRWAQPALQCICSPVLSDACHTCRGAKGIRHVTMTTSPPHAHKRMYASHTAGAQIL